MEHWVGTQENWVLFLAVALVPYVIVGKLLPLSGTTFLHLYKGDNT